MITRATLSTIEQGLPKYRSMLAGNPAFSPGAFESIATLTGDNTVTSITFSSIPATYQHLQLRIIANTNAGIAEGDATLIINGDTGSSYATHYLSGNNTTMGSNGSANRAHIWLPLTFPGTSYSSSYHGASIIDILDYASSTKNKTVRIFNGVTIALTSTSQIRLVSGVRMNTEPITSLRISYQGYTVSSTSQFALYGIKGS